MRQVFAEFVYKERMRPILICPISPTVEAHALGACQCRFESCVGHHKEARVRALKTLAAKGAK